MQEKQVCGMTAYAASIEAVAGPAIFADKFTDALDGHVELIEHSVLHDLLCFVCQL